MHRAGIESIELSDEERRLLHEIVYCEVSVLLDGNAVRAEDIGRAPWSCDGQGSDQRVCGEAEEYRIRFTYIADLVHLLDIIGWDRERGSNRVFLYPPVVRALRFCKVFCDRQAAAAEGSPEDGDLEDKREAKALVDTLLAVADE